MSILSLLFVILVYLVLFYIATRKLFTPKPMSAIFLGVTVMLGFSGVMSAILFWPALILFSVITLLIYSPTLQQKLIWSRLFGYLKKNIPSISRTEQIAADAGGVWWEQELFSGAPDWDKLFHLPEAEFTTAEKDFLDKQLVQLCQLVDRSAIESNRGLPEPLWRFLKKHRFFALVIPEGFGGHGFSHRMHAEVVSRLAICSSSLAVTVMVPNSLGPGELIIKYGTPAQKKYHLPRLSSGKDIPCFGLTSQTAGSDANSIEDSGVICQGTYKNKKVLGLRLNWSKRYITLAPVATLIGLAVKVYDPDHLLPEDHHLHGEENLGISCVLVAADTAGVDIGRCHNPMNVRFHNGPISGTDVFVPLDNIIGGDEMIGEGWRMLMECLSVGRCISLPALSAAANQLALASSTAYSHSRTQFGHPIAKFDAVALENAHIALNTLSSTAAADMATDILDHGKTSAVMSAMVKLYATEAYRDSINRAMDIHAGKAVMLGSRNYLDELYRSIPIAITVEGANILLRNLMIFGQGMLRCHPYLRREIDLIATKDSVDREVAIAFEAHFAHVIRNFLKAVSYSWSANTLSPSVSSVLPRKPQRQIGTLCAQMATLVEISLALYGGSLKRKELVSGSFAQAWTELFCASAILRKRAAVSDDLHSAQACDLAVKRCLARCQDGLVAIIDNFPINRVLQTALRWTLLPAWNRVAPPSNDELLALSEALADPDGLRRFLSQRVFAVLEHDSGNHPLQAVEKAMAAAEQLGLLRNRLPAHLSSQIMSANMCDVLNDPLAREALGKDGVAQWRQCAERIREAMVVDEFDGQESFS